MQYNIWLEVAALSFNLLIWIFYKLQYQSRQVVNKRFEILTCFVFMLTLTDIASAITISYHSYVPIWLNYLFNGSNYIFAGLSGFAFVLYVRTLVDRNHSLWARIDNILLFIFIVSELVNLYTGHFFSFDETGYIHGPLYLLPLLYSYYFLLDTAIILVLFGRRLTPRKILGASSYAILMLITGILQIFVIPHFLLTGFASTITIFIMFLLMETPDYYKLIDTMKDLEEAKIVANKASEAKSRFLANMSHEIRTPLNTVIGMDEMILREADNSDILDYARNIKASGATLLGIINDILDFSKIESGKLVILSAPYNLSDTINNVNNMLRQRAVDKGLEFIINVEPSLPSVLVGDSMRISQIIINLANNAIKYTEKGKVELSFTGRPSIDSDTVILTIAVTDTGIGIKEEDKLKLFEEFERLDLERNRKIEGTGLGLAITGRLVQQMNGKIAVDSTYGQGSVFTVELPQTVKNSLPIGQLKTSMSSENYKTYKSSFTAPNARLLAVDDTPVNLIVLQKLLKQTQIQISTATSGREALQLIKQNSYDIVLLDHMMPEMDGIETLHKAKELYTDSDKRPVFIVLTANAIQGANEMYIKEGFDAYLSKPIDFRVLEDVLKHCLPEELITSNQ